MISWRGGGASCQEPAAHFCSFYSVVFSSIRELKHPINILCACIILHPKAKNPKNTKATQWSSTIVRATSCDILRRLTWIVLNPSAPTLRFHLGPSGSLATSAIFLTSFTSCFTRRSHAAEICLELSSPLPAGVSRGARAEFPRTFAQGRA